MTAADRRRLRRRGDALFVPRIETAWTDGAAEAPPDIRDLLTGSGANSQPLRGRAWQEVLPHFPDWAQRCAAADPGRADRAVTPRRSPWPRPKPWRSPPPRRHAGRVSCGPEQPFIPAATRTSAPPIFLAWQRRLAEQFQNGLRQPRSELLACTAIVLLPADD